MRHDAARAAALAAVALACGCRGRASGMLERSDLDGPYLVESVVDGDTIRVSSDGVEQKVRLLCIDTPETRGDRKSPLGDRATATLDELIDGRDVYLRTDDVHEDVDRYGRLLRYVFLDDGTVLNIEMVRLGWSAYYTKYGPCARFHMRLLDAEHAARTSQRGIWAHPEFIDAYLRNARGAEAVERQAVVPP
jgi:micrococcal nuclease